MRIRNLGDYFLNVIFLTLEKLIKFAERYWLHAIIIAAVSGIFWICFKLEINHNNANSFLDMNFWLDNLIPNIIADMIGIILTTFIIAGLFSRNTKRSQEGNLYRILGRDFEGLIKLLSRNFLYLLRRNPDYLSYLVDDKQIEEEIKKIATLKDLSFNFNELNTPFDAWDVSQSSLIYDEFIVTIPRIKEHLEIMDKHAEKTQALLIETKFMEYHLKSIEDRIGTNSFHYKDKLTEYNKLKNDLKSLVWVKTPIKDEYLKVDIMETLTGLKTFFDNKNNSFLDKYNPIVPLDIRTSFIGIKGSLNAIANNIHEYNNAEEYTDVNLMSIDEFKKRREAETYYCVIKLSKQLLELSNYFNKVKYF